MTILGRNIQDAISDPYITLDVITPMPSTRCRLLCNLAKPPNELKFNRKAKLIRNMFFITFRFSNSTLSELLDRPSDLSSLFSVRTAIEKLSVFSASTVRLGVACERGKSGERRVGPSRPVESISEDNIRDSCLSRYLRRSNGESFKNRKDLKQ